MKFDKELPQLIVALDSSTDDANYIHIDDVKENVTYYCPCCKGIIKPRAFKKDINYQVQPHFYHETGGCSDETYVHYICKTWLFMSGSKFLVNDILYEVKNIEIEKTLHTSFGDYRPDIIVAATVGKIFYFEIKTTNKKTELYAPKWDELGNDVVEVDTRYFINSKYKNEIPKFALIYSNGECFIKNYTKNDYEGTIAKRKLEWKRQDKLNYKIQWERLDWFWQTLHDYSNKKKDVSDVLEYFKQLDYEDKTWCYYTIKNKSCMDLKESFREIINQYFYDMIDSFKEKYSDISIELVHVSPMIYLLECRYRFDYLDYEIFEKEVVKIKYIKGKILSLEYKSDIQKSLDELNINIQLGNEKLKRVNDISKLPFVKEIKPYSHYSASKYPLSDLRFTVVFEDYIHNKFIKEIIGEIDLVPCEINKECVKKYYTNSKNTSLYDLDAEFIEYALKNDSSYQKILRELKGLCDNTGFLRFWVSYNTSRVALMDCHTIYEYEIDENCAFGEFERKIKSIFTPKIKEEIKYREKIKSYVDKINSCKNSLWKAEVNMWRCSITIYLKDPTNSEIIESSETKSLNSAENMEQIEIIIYETMKTILNHAENYKGIRFVKDNIIEQKKMMK